MLGCPEWACWKPCKFAIESKSVLPLDVSWPQVREAEVSVNDRLLLQEAQTSMQGEHKEGGGGQGAALIFLLRLKVLWVSLSPAQGCSGKCKAGNSTLEELVKMRKAASALGLEGNGGISPLWWKSGCAEGLWLAMRARNMVGLSKDTWQQGFWTELKRGRQGQEGAMRPAQALAALPWGRARFRMKPWCSWDEMCKGLCGAKAELLHRCF